MIVSAFSFLLFCHGSVHALGCYNCITRNGSVETCEDSFRDNRDPTLHVNKHCSDQLWAEDRMMLEGWVETGVVGERTNYCVKVIATVKKTKEKLIIRGCVGGEGDVTSQCGEFRWREEKMKGCILTCQNDFCNTANPVAPVVTTLLLLLAHRWIRDDQNV